MNRLSIIEKSLVASNPNNTNGITVIFASEDSFVVVIYKQVVKGVDNLFAVFGFTEDQTNYLWGVHSPVALYDLLHNCNNEQVTLAMRVYVDNLDPSKLVLAQG